MLRRTLPSSVCLFILTIIFSLTFLPAFAAEKSFPENITPNDVYKVVLQLNAYADALLKHQKIKKWDDTPKIGVEITPMVVYQLHIATIELLHNYELNLGLRAVPIIAAAPVQYYPADVKFLTDLILLRMKKIANHFGIKAIAQINLDKVKDHTPQDVYHGMLSFYLKLSDLDNQPGITLGEVWMQLHRVNLEFQDIVLHYAEQQKNIRGKRILAGATYGRNPYSDIAPQKAVTDTNIETIYQQALMIRHLMNPFLKKYKIEFIPLKKIKPKQQPSTIDIFIQSQIILAELNEWKRVLNIGQPDPITLASKDKSVAAIFKETAAIIFMLERLNEVLKLH